MLTSQQVTSNHSPSFDENLLHTQQILRNFYAAAASGCANKPLSDWQITKLRNEESRRSSASDYHQRKAAKLLPSQKFHRSGSLKFEFQGAVLRAKYRASGGQAERSQTFERGWDETGFKEYQPKAPKGNKSKITAFSASSRRTLLDKLMSIEKEAWVRAKFLTLTFHEEWPDDPNDAKAMVRALFKRIIRWCEKKNLNPKLRVKYAPAFFWRMEVKPRQTGVRVNELAPHFHCFLFGCPNIPRQLLLKWWRQIAKDKSITQLDIRKLDGRRKAMNYVAKYVSKPAAGDVYLEALQAQAEAVGRSLDVGLYQADTGRFWGFEGGDNLPYAAVRTVVLDALSPSALRFILACEERWPFLQERWSLGFRVFDFDGAGLDDVRSWLVTEVGGGDRLADVDFVDRVDLSAAASPEFEDFLMGGDLDFDAAWGRVVWDSVKRSFQWA